VVWYSRVYDGAQTALRQSIQHSSKPVQRPDKKRQGSVRWVLVCWTAQKYRSKPDVKELNKKYTPPQMSSEKDAIKVSTAS